MKDRNSTFSQLDRSIKNDSKTSTPSKLARKQVLASACKAVAAQVFMTSQLVIVDLMTSRSWVSQLTSGSLAQMDAMLNLRQNAGACRCVCCRRDVIITMHWRHSRFVGNCRGRGVVSLRLGARLHCCRASVFRRWRRAQKLRVQSVYDLSMFVRYWTLSLYTTSCCTLAVAHRLRVARGRRSLYSFVLLCDLRNVLRVRGDTVSRCCDVSGCGGVDQVTCKLVRRRWWRKFKWVVLRSTVARQHAWANQIVVAAAVWRRGDVSGYWLDAGVPSDGWRWFLTLT